MTLSARRGFRTGVARRGGSPRPPGREGFTLVEIMVVMAILVMLFGLVAVSLSSYLSKASRAATIGRLTRLQSYLEDYKHLTGHYPPDGIDSPVKTEDGQYIKGSACLHYFLTRPVRVAETVAGRKSFREAPPVGEFTASELTKEDPEYPGVREILDGWDVPFHYDNTENGHFEPQLGDVHFPPLADDEHPPDPRDGALVVDGQNAVEKAGVQSSGYDIWSHGEQGHDLEKPSLPLATWNKEQ